MTLVLADAIGVTALYLLFGWLICSAICGWIAARKGFQEKYGIATGLILVPLGVIIWLLWPAREGSDWKALGAFGRGGQ
ncbi:MAG: hypothetical protein JHC95_01990 [Solirubrobacteraceae bacterium]|nr:hypothetical protein [Solirubrobacteraceae bacterium]